MVGNRKDLLISEICKADRNQDKGNVESNKEEKGFGKRKKANMEIKVKILALVSQVKRRILIKHVIAMKSG